jgi:cytochrome P450
MCLGDQYAMVEMQLVLAVIGSSVELGLRPGSEIAAVARLGLLPAKKIELIVRPRRARADAVTSAAAPA